MSSGDRSETDLLLRDIRDLLLPIADHYRDEYEERLAVRLRAKTARVLELVSRPKRRAAWDLIDGLRTQREISRESTLDEGSTSKLFKALRELGAIVDTPNPVKTLEID